MNHDAVRSAYGPRALEYRTAVGSIEHTHPADRELVAAWAAGLKGPVVDAGCGPGHWTRFLAEHGARVEGLDVVSEFVALAAELSPGFPFRVGSLEDLGVEDGSLGGIFAWYSMIHLEPAELPAVLAEYARCLRPGGALLTGFFEGPEVERFPHAVMPAYFWPVDELVSKVTAAGFEVLETHRRADTGRRPHAAVTARRLGRP
ncbi:class I SAM-dependent methyltransferase [Arthrobacter sp. Z1-15]